MKVSIVIEPADEKHCGDCPWGTHWDEESRNHCGVVLEDGAMTCSLFGYESTSDLECGKNPRGTNAVGIRCYECIEAESRMKEMQG